VDIGNLTFKIDEDGTISLVLQGPNVQLLEKPALQVKPAIGLSRDKQGRYHFLVGSDDTIVDPVNVGEELRKLFSSPPSSTKASLKLPSCRQLRNAKGGFRTFEEYDLDRRLFHDAVPINGVVWPVLTPQLYDALVTSYQRAGGECGK
jgi:hypothetical protein